MLLRACSPPRLTPTCKDIAAGGIWVVTTERIRSNGHKLKHRKFSLNVWGEKKYHEGEVQEPFARRIVESPSLEMFQTWMDTVLRTRWPCPSRKGGLHDLQRSLPPQPSCKSVRLIHAAMEYREGGWILNTSTCQNWNYSNFLKYRFSVIDKLFLQTCQTGEMNISLLFI